MTGWACDKEILLRTYKTYVEPSINYAAAVWVPNASASSIAAIQRIQNRALRIALGCHTITPISHLHQEAQYALVEDHLNMLCTQFLASSLRLSHPSHEVVTSPSGPRSMKSTLQSKFSASVEPYLSNGVVDPASYTEVIKEIHTQAVRSTISKLGVNPLLGAPPPPISPSERRLMRIQRTTLSQLRLGHCKLLGDYKVRVGLGSSALCPECLFRRQTVPHIFDCDSAQTTLSLRDLWTNPATVVDHLVSLPTFSSLIVPQDPQLPPPPPEPPPPT